MDHVIADLQRWLDIYEGDEEHEQDKEAIRCIKKAINELQKYYRD